MRILHVNFSFTNGGIDNMMIDIMKQQKLKGCDVYLLIINNNVSSEMRKAIPSNIKTFFINRPPASKNIIYPIRIYWIINHYIHPDVIHCHNSAIGKLLRFDKHPKLLTVHAMKYPTQNYKYFDWVVSISHAVQEDVCKTFHTKNISTIYNGVDFSQIEIKNQITSNNKIFHIAVISRLVHETKGQDLLIYAINDIKSKTNKKIILDIIGEGKSKQYLTNLATELKLSEHINFLGEKKRTWIYENLKNYDLLVQPSRDEGFGLTIIEGFAAKVPVLASDIDAPQEILLNGKYGYIFKSNDVKSLSEVLLYIVQLPDPIKIEKSQIDYQYMKNKFSIETTVNNYIHLYKSIINK